MRSGSKIRALCSPPPCGEGSRVGVAPVWHGHATPLDPPPRPSPTRGEGGSGAALTRRRAIRIVAAAAGLPLVVAAVRAAAPPGQLFSWQGEVVGALSELTLWHTDAALARRTILKVRGEIARYERIFSLYRQDSEISRLNGAGTLHKPSGELRSLVEESRRIGVLSDGAFDISVQPLWRLYEAHFWSHSDVVDDLARRAAEVARENVDFRNIETSAASVSF